MTTLDSCRIGAPAPALLMKRPHNATVHECEQPEGVCPVTELREALAREAALLRERDALIERQKTLSRESAHRFLNNLPLVSSLLSMQSRAAANPETASAFALAADRVSTIGRIHRHLHSVDNVEAVAFKRFTEELSRDVMGMMIGIPLGFIVSELITNAVKYGQGAITVRLGADPRKGWTLSVENRGPPLPEGFDPAQSKGFGMRIIRSFVATIGGQPCIGRDEHDQGARFTVLFAGA